MLLSRHARAVEHETDESFARQSTDERTAAPRRERSPGVELQPGRRDDGIPVVDRLLHARDARRRGTEGARDRLRPRILDAIRLEWPAVVLPLLDQVQLVPAARAVLHLPEA